MLMLQRNFVYNTLSIRLATGRAKARSWCATQVRTIKDNLRAIGQRRRVGICWVPGHAGIEGNELADGKAKEGAAGITGYGPRQKTAKVIVRQPEDKQSQVQPETRAFKDVLTRVRHWAANKHRNKTKRLKSKKDRLTVARRPRNITHIYNTRLKAKKALSEQEKNHDCPT